MTDDSKEFFKRYDVNENGIIDPEEWSALELENKRREMIDSDAKRDAKRRITYFAASGMLIYPFGVVITEYFGLGNASQFLSSMSSIYYGSVSVIVASYFAFEGGKKS